MTLTTLLLLSAASFAPPLGAANQEAEAVEEVFSGPQKGEKLLPFELTGVYDELAGKKLDPIGNAAGKPVLLVFVHKLTRPSHGLTRLITDYAADRAKNGAGEPRLVTRLVWLQDDQSKARDYLTRVRETLGLRVPIGISPDGAEGPGAYGLNRNVILTVLVGQAGRVTANFALVQPSDTDAPRILAEVARLIGEEPPTMEDLLEQAGGGRGMGMTRRPDARLGALLARLRPAGLTPEQVEKLAAQVTKYVGKDAGKQSELGLLARAETAREDFETTGTAAARATLRRWAKRYAPRAR